MVRPHNVARSRACQQCKRKRIKCDLQMPCQRCVNSNLICSGPIVGLMVMNTSSTSYGKTKGDFSESKSPVSSPEQSQEANTVREISMSPAMVNEVLLWDFLCYYSQDAGGRVWMNKLPALVSAKNAVAMKSAAWAVSLAFAAQKSKDVAMTHAAREFYGKSLRYHQFSFKAPDDKTICRAKAHNALPVTVLLSYFEMIQATSPDAWLKHTLAAERLYVRLGPSSLLDPLLNHLYFIVRINAVTRCLLTGAETKFAEDEWKHNPILAECGRGTRLLHRVIDVILDIAHGANILKSTYPSYSEPGDMMMLQSKLDELMVHWNEFGGAFGLDTTVFSLFVDKHASAVSPALCTLPAPLQDPSIALTATYFYATAILILTLVEHRRPSRPTLLLPESNLSSHILFQTIEGRSPRRQAIHDLSSQILTLAEYLRLHRVGCLCTRMVLPLALVHRLSPSKYLSILAKKLIQSWSAQDGMPDLIMLAFNSEIEAI